MVTKIENLPHVCNLSKGYPGCINNCGNSYVQDYGFFFFDYPNKDHENYHTIQMQYGFKFYEIKVHKCYNFGCYCEIRNILDNILEKHFDYKQGFQNHCIRDPLPYVDMDGYNCYGEHFSVQNNRRFFDHGFHEQIGYGYYVNWKPTELLKFDFSNYVLPEEWSKDAYMRGMFETNKNNLEMIFGCKLEKIEKDKLKLASRLLKERVKPTYQYE